MRRFSNFRGRETGKVQTIRGRPWRSGSTKWTSEGALLIRVEDTRSQARNREIAEERLAEMIRAALVAPKRRVPTKPTLGSKRRRIEGKKKRGEVKALRGKVEE